jgi:hypothetical protein
MNDLCEQLLILTSEERDIYGEIIVIIASFAILELGMLFYFYRECL